MRKSRRPQLPKARNFYAAAVNTPGNPFRPKTIPNKKDKPLPRKHKHKGKPDED